MLLLHTMLADLPFGKPQRAHLGDLPPQLAGLPVRPTHRHPARFGDRGPHMHSRQAARPCDFAALNLAGLCAVVPYAHELARLGTAPASPRAAASCRGSVGAGTAGRAGWPGAGSRAPVRPGPGGAVLPSRPRLPAARGDGHAGPARRGPGGRAPPRHPDLRGRRPPCLRTHGRGAGRTVPGTRGQAAPRRRPVGALDRTAHRPARPPAQVRRPLRPHPHRRAARGRAAGRGPALWTSVPAHAQPVLHLAVRDQDQLPQSGQAGAGKQPQGGFHGDLEGQVPDQAQAGVAGRRGRE